MLWHINVNCKMKQWKHCGHEEVLIYLHEQCIIIQTQKHLSFGTDYKGKDKFSTSLFTESLYRNHILPDKDVAEEII